MKKCLKCNTENPDSFKTCWSCGGELPVSEVREEAVGAGPKKGHSDVGMPKTSARTRRRFFLVSSIVAGLALIGFGVLLSRLSGTSQYDDVSTNVSLFGVGLGDSVDVSDYAQLMSLHCFKDPERVPGGYKCRFCPPKKFMSFDFYTFFVDSRTGKITSVTAESLSSLDASVAYNEIEASIMAVKKKFGVPEAKVDERSYASDNRHDPLVNLMRYGVRRTFYSVELCNRYVLEASAQSDGGFAGQFFKNTLTVRDKLSQLSKDDVDAL